MIQTRKLEKITVVGGGTAGWLTALYVKTCLPDSEVTLIESEEIGILGAGEGSTPHLVYLLDLVGIPVSRVIKETGATIKTGIKFTNWNNDGEFYYHGFAMREGFGFNSVQINPLALSTLSTYVSNAVKNEKLGLVDMSEKLGESNKVPFTVNRDAPADVSNTIFKFNNYGDFSLHFDAKKLAELLRSIGEDRGIKRIEGIVASTEEDSYGDIKTITLESGEKGETDFVFDCTGFARFLIGKKFKSEWDSYSEYLPVNAAIPFFLPANENNTPPYTEAIAMKYGWIWKIPLQHRFGCGYVYDSSLITEKQAMEEIEDYLGFEPEYPRKDKGGFKFSAGSYKQPWIKNCIAVGLSSGFIEPLEATSIWVSIMSLREALSNVELMTLKDDRVSDEYNSYMQKINEEVRNFVYFHYMSNRNDTEFWEKFSDYNKAPEGVKTIVNKWSYRPPRVEDKYGIFWTIESWYAVGCGINLVDKEVIKRSYTHADVSKWAFGQYGDLKAKQDDAVKHFMDHSQFIEELKHEI
jgi:tryptophan halogenase